MAKVLDVARYILEQRGSLTTMKLQKLVYYSQAWHASWDDERLFPERFEAWINGPICPDLFSPFQGRFQISAEEVVDGDSNNLTDSQKESIDSVLEYYGDKSSQWLSDLTHAEEPWKKARKGLALNQRGNHEITLGSMVDYYSNLSSEQHG